MGRSAAGFTLIELIMVIILLGIVATISVRFVTLSTQGAIDASERQKRALKGVVLSERLTRELRESVPGSVNVSGNCISFVPLRGAGIYQEVTGASGPEYKVIPAPDEADWVPVVASPSGEITSLEYPLAASQQSPQKRFYYVAATYLFFQENNKLYRQVIEGDFEAGCSGKEADPQRILATNVTGLLFSEDNGRVTFQFLISSESSNESMPFTQTLQVRNVP
jgi:MSHA biogenesis protein MshO